MPQARSEPTPNDSPLTLDDLAKQAGRRRGCVLTIGNYDGVHRGHQALIRRTAEAARVRETQAVALTFSPHPVRFFKPDAEAFELTTLGQKKVLLRHYGMDDVLVLTFDEQLSQLEPAAFVRRVLVEGLEPSVVIVGFDFAFGRGAAGNASLLGELLAEHGILTHVVPEVSLGQDALSSTAIRQALDDGAVDQVRKRLGHPHALVGEVTHGAGRGRGLGFPTANCAVENERLPAKGVYATLLETQDARWEAITNIGVRPTFGGTDVTVESFVLANGVPDELDLYGERVAVHLLARIREERRFDSSAELVAQIEADIAVCREHHAGDDLRDFAPQVAPRVLPRSETAA